MIAIGLPSFAAGLCLATAKGGATAWHKGMTSAATIFNRASRRLLSGIRLHRCNYVEDGLQRASSQQTLRIPTAEGSHRPRFLHLIRPSMMSSTVTASSLTTESVKDEIAGTISPHKGQLAAGRVASSGKRWSYGGPYS